MKNRTEHLIKTAQAIAVDAMGYRDPTRNGLPPPLDPKLVGRMVSWSSSSPLLVLAFFSTDLDHVLYSSSVLL
jgi:hypothetical protein